jgi:hypothetical protein
LRGAFHQPDERKSASPLWVNSVAYVMSASCPVHPQLQTFLRFCRTSGKGHERQKALPISEIGILQEQERELLVRAHHFPDIIFDFEIGMHHGPIMSSSDKCEKREQILKAFAAQCLPQCLLGTLGL